MANLQEVDAAIAQVQTLSNALHELRGIVVNAPDDVMLESEFDKDLAAAGAGAGDHLDAGMAKFVQLSESQPALLALAESAQSDTNTASRGQQVVDGIKSVLGFVIPIVEKVAVGVLG